MVVSYKCLKNMKTRTIEGTAWNSKEAIRIMNRAIDNSQLFDMEYLDSMAQYMGEYLMIIPLMEHYLLVQISKMPLRTLEQKKVILL